MEKGIKFVAKSQGNARKDKLMDGRCRIEREERESWIGERIDE